MAFEHPHWLRYMPSPEMPADGSVYQRRWLAFIPIALSILIIGIDMSVIGVAAPALATGLGATTSDIQWIFDAFTVALGGFVLLGGGLADHFGRKGVFQTGMAVFAAGSLFAAFAPSAPALIAARAVMGIGAALVMPPPCPC